VTQCISAALLFCMLALPTTVAAQSFTSQAWPEADQLFRRDPRWLGADAAYSIPLGGDRVLWLFGDSWIAPPGRPLRRYARMISNTIGMQEGTDPSRATMHFYWAHTPGGDPRAFFTPPDHRRLWPSHGIRLGDRLLLFFMCVFPSTGGLGFEVKEWKALLVYNPDANPTAWHYEWLRAPAVRAQIIIGTGGVIAQGDYVYAFSAQEPGGRHPIFLARWKRSEARAGRLKSLEWWDGSAGWLPDSTLTAAPTPLFDDAQTEFSVHYDSVSARYLQVQSYGFGPAVIGLRTAPRMTGPWRGGDTLYVPPEFSRSNIMIYAAKAHPELQGADLVLTYATNAPFEEQVRDTTVYYPRFVRLQRRPR
jgi:Domain of unknown function (DUF4185)